MNKAQTTMVVHSITQRQMRLERALNLIATIADREIDEGTCEVCADCEHICEVLSEIHDLAAMALDPNYLMGDRQAEIEKKLRG
jgi:hypothetical protein